MWLHDSPLTGQDNWPAPCDCWEQLGWNIGHSVRVYHEVSSTNDLAKLLAWQVPSGTVIRALRQTAGRGQYGRSWQGGDNCSVLLSVIVTPPPGFRRPVVLTAWATVAVARTIQELCGTTPRLKWPNDLQIGGKKLSGILIESVTCSETKSCIIVGIGLNVRQTAADFAKANLPEATSLWLQGSSVSPDDAARRLITHLNQTYECLIATGGTAIEAAWSEMLALRHIPAIIEFRDQSRIVGVVHNLSFIGVEIMTPTGRIVREAETIVRILPDSATLIP
jgi:BirA family biotin operon repressor/biotin-[acetyl-CoA-carboxylase] ligase